LLHLFLVPTKSPLALKHIQDFIYYVFTFYTGILKDQTLCLFRAGRLEALGNPTRLKIYRALVRAGDPGLAVGRLQEKLKIAPSNLHLQR